MSFSDFFHCNHGNICDTKLKCDWLEGVLVRCPVIGWRVGCPHLWWQLAERDLVDERRTDMDTATALAGRPGLGVNIQGNYILNTQDGRLPVSLWYVHQSIRPHSHRANRIPSNVHVDI